MKSHEALIKKVKNLIGKNKVNEVFDILFKEKLPTLDNQLTLIKSRYSKLKDQERLNLIDDKTAEITFNNIKFDLLDLVDNIGKIKEKEILPPSDVSNETKEQSSTPPAKEIKKPTPTPSPLSNPSAKGKSKSTLFIGGTIGILLLALIGYFGMQQSAKKSEAEKLAKIEFAKKKRAKTVKDSLSQVALQALETAKRDSINRAKNIKIGNSFEGGVIFYIDKTGQHGLIMAKGDQSTKPINWFQGTTGKALATDTGIYDGANNTKLLIAKFKEENHPAQLCDKFKFGEYDDWYLPSKDELDLLFDFHKTLPKAQKLEPKYYWSSSESSSQDVYYRSFHNGKGYTWIKGNKAKVRAIRKF